MSQKAFQLLRTFILAFSIVVVVGQINDVRAFGSASTDYRINRIVFSPDGKLLLADTSDSLLKLWDVQTGKLLHTFTEATFAYHEATFNFSPDSRYIATSGGLNKTVILWDVSSGKQVRTFSSGLDLDKNSFDSEIQKIIPPIFSPDGKYVLANNTLGVYLWDVETGTLVR